MDLDPGTFNGIFTTLGHGHTLDGWLCLFNLHARDTAGNYLTDSGSMLYSLVLYIYCIVCLRLPQLRIKLHS